MTRKDDDGIIDNQELTANRQLRGLEQQIGKLIKGDGSGMYEAARLIMTEIAPVWESKYQAQAEGKSLSSWLCACHGLNQRYFAQRHEAVQKFGRELLRVAHHDLAPWLLRQTVDDLQRRKIVIVLADLARKKNNGRPTSYGQGTVAVNKILGKQVRVLPEVARLRERVAELEQFIRANGLGVPEWR